MQTFLYATIAVSGMRILATIAWTRRNRFILSAAFGLGLLDIVVPEWFSQVLAYDGDNVHLSGFLDGVNLMVETPFILSMIVGVILNIIMPKDKSSNRALAAPLSEASSSTQAERSPSKRGS